MVVWLPETTNDKTAENRSSRPQPPILPPKDMHDSNVYRRQSYDIAELTFIGSGSEAQSNGRAGLLFQSSHVVSSIRLVQNTKSLMQRIMPSFVLLVRSWSVQISFSDINGRSLLFEKTSRTILCRTPCRKCNKYLTIIVNLSKSCISWNSWERLAAVYPLRPD